MNLDEPLTLNELGVLEEALISDTAPEHCMDVSMLDGFLTCLAIGPGIVEAARWLPRVWGHSPEGRGGFATREEAETVVALVVRLMNSIVRLFSENPEGFSPILYQGASEEGAVTIIDEWCMGFMHGVAFGVESWAPLFEDEAHQHLLAPMYHYGTEQGWKQLDEDPAVSAVPHEEWVEMLGPSVEGIRAFWVERRARDGVVGDGPGTPGDL